MARTSLTKHKLDPAETAGLMSTIRGLNLGILFSDKTSGKLRVDFGTNVTLEPETAKAAVLYVLAKRGAMIDEFEEWKPAVKGKTFYLEGNLGPSGMLRITSMFNRPPFLEGPGNHPTRCRIRHRRWNMLSRKVGS